MVTGDPTPPPPPTQCQISTSWKFTVPPWCGYLRYTPPLTPSPLPLAPHWLGGTTSRHYNTVLSWPKLVVMPSYGGSPVPIGYEVLQPMSLTQGEAQTEALSCKPPQRFWYLPPLDTEYGRTVPIYSTISGGSRPPHTSWCNRRTAYFPGTWRCQTSKAPGTAPGNPSPLLIGRRLKIDGTDFVPPLSFTLRSLGVLPPSPPGVWTCHTARTGGGGKGPIRGPQLCPPCAGSWNSTRGWCGWKPSLERPPPGSWWPMTSAGITPVTTSSTVEAVAEIVAWTVPTGCAAYGGGRTYMLWPNLCCNNHIPPCGVASYGEGLPPRSSAAHMLRRSVVQQWAQADTPLPLSLLCSFWDEPVQKG